MEVARAEAQKRPRGVGVVLPLCCMMVLLMMLMLLLMAVTVAVTLASSLRATTCLPLES